MLRSLRKPFLYALVTTLFLLFVGGCSNPVAGDDCDAEGAQESGLLCSNGIWTVDDGDVGVGEDTGSADVSVEDTDLGGGDVDASGEDVDASDEDADVADIGCQPESDEETCTSAGVDCGRVANNCGEDVFCDFCDGVKPLCDEDAQECVEPECTTDDDCTESTASHCQNYQCVCAFNIYTASEDDTVRKIDYDGKEVWQYDEFSETPIQLTVDSQGYSYVAVDDFSIRKLDASGGEVWAQPTTYIAHAIAVDTEGYIYAPSESGGALQKFDAQGSVVWTNEPFSYWIVRLLVDGDGNLYTASNAGPVHKLDPSGDVLWEFDESEWSVHGLAIDSEGYIYTGDSEGWLRRVDPDGEQVWEHWIPDWINDLAVDREDNLYVAHGESVSKFDPQGEVVWQFVNHTDDVRALSVDDEGYVYTGSEDTTVRKLDPDGHEVWSFDGHTDTVRSIAVDPGLFSAGFEGCPQQ